MPRGSKPGERRGGRKPGTPNKKTTDIEAKLAALNCDPLELLARVANGEALEVRLPNSPEHSEPIEQWPTLEQRIAASKELAQYVAPKRKAIEHSGHIATHEDSLEALADDGDGDEC